MMKLRKPILFALLASLPFGVSAQADTTSLDAYLDMSLEQLMDIEITSVSKKAERIQDVPSSIYVLTADDISRSASQNLMQLLREKVPGFWAVENDYRNVDALMRNTFEGSVLVLLDGTPMQELIYSSFDYENFDIPMEQIDRIEVIRGSGGTVYGANSATGVISIYTKQTEDNSKLMVGAEYAYPGESKFSILSSPLQKGKFTTSLYGKYLSFSGFDQLPETVNNFSVVPKHDGTGDTTITNRFSGDDNTVTSIAGGFKLGYQATDNLKLTSSLHVNNSTRNRYVQYFPNSKAMFINTGTLEPKPYAGDSVSLEEKVKTRLVGNVEAAYTFNDQHSVFARISSNYENSDLHSGGGFKAKTSIIDFEAQDNLTLGINTFSLGVNYRIINYNFSDFSDANQVYFTENINEATLLGVFVQDKISLLDDKLNLYLGGKAENFSLINDDFYFSPMVKVTLAPDKDLTLWGGFTQSYTTPGYIQTNVEFFIFRAESPEVFYNYTYPLVQYAVYQNAYQQAISGGAEEATASAMAQAYIESDEGLQVIDNQTNEAIADNAVAFPGHYNIGGKNGPNTEPSSFTNFEAGLRFSGIKNLAFETNFYYSIMQDGVGNSLSASSIIPSETQDGEFILPYYYGNYFQGTTLGLETVVKYVPMEKVRLELSHAWTDYTLELQENEEFAGNPHSLHFV